MTDCCTQCSGATPLVDWIAGDVIEGLPLKGRDDLARNDVDSLAVSLGETSAIGLDCSNLLSGGLEGSHRTKDEPHVSRRIKTNECKRRVDRGRTLSFRSLVRSR
jgi:hypothetical protein